MANETGSNQTSTRKKIREWKNTKARQRRQTMSYAAPDPNVPF